MPPFSLRAMPDGCWKEGTGGPESSARGLVFARRLVFETVREDWNCGDINADRALWRSTRILLPVSFGVGRRAALLRSYAFGMTSAQLGSATPESF
jgi:hypothetical protein